MKREGFPEEKEVEVRIFSIKYKDAVKLMDWASKKGFYARIFQSKN